MINVPRKKSALITMVPRKKINLIIIKVPRKKINSIIIKVPRKKSARSSSTLPASTKKKLYKRINIYQKTSAQSMKQFKLGNIHIFVGNL